MLFITLRSVRGYAASHFHYIHNTSYRYSKRAHDVKVYKYSEVILTHKHWCTHTHLKSQVLGSRLSMPGSPLTASWEGRVTEVDRVGVLRKRWRNLPEDICHCEQLASCFFAACCVTHRFSCMTDQELWAFLEGPLAPEHGLGDPVWL